MLEHPYITEISNELEILYDEILYDADEMDWL
jgi:hypothetical protein